MDSCCVVKTKGNGSEVEIQITKNNEKIFEKKYLVNLQTQYNSTETEDETEEVEEKLRKLVEKNEGFEIEELEELEEKKREREEYRKYEEDRTKEYKLSQERNKDSQRHLKEEIESDEKLTKFEKEFLKRGKKEFEKLKEGYSGEIEDIDEEYRKFEEYRIRVIKFSLQQRENRLSRNKEAIEEIKKREKFEKIFLKRGEEVFEKIFTD